MKQKKSKKKKQALSPMVVVLTIVLVLVAALLVYMAVSILGGERPVSGSPGETTGQIQETTVPSPTTELPIETTGTDMVVNTPYGKLYYPAELMQYVKVEQENDGKNVIIRFLAKIDDVEYTEVFSVWFGKKQELVCGTVAGEKGEVVIVGIDMNLDIPQDDWHENMRIRTFTLQEAVNDLMARLNELDSFVPAK